jgi:class 3 adenylate cyclase
MEEVGPGVTLAERLESLAVHNAYHLGKIVALRQVIDAWPPPG